jgi:hypothetical protein
MDFESFMDRAWDEHAEQPAAVAVRLAESGLPLLGDEAQLIALARLAHHLHGEHLGQWQQGTAFQAQLAALPVCAAEGEATVQRHVVSLELAAGLADRRDGLSVSDRIRVGALAAASLVARDLPRASALLHQALAEAEAAGLPDGDPYARALAVTGNNLACELEERPQRSADERTLMILAAQTARRYWALAGGWRETARAEYRLGMTWLRAGDAELAGWHAQQCLDITGSHGGLAMDRFLAWEVVASSARARADTAGAALALTELQATLAEVDEGDRVWCRSRWTELAGPSP